MYTILQYTHTSYLFRQTHKTDPIRSQSQYPLNPNGSPLGVAALCSTDGRHLAMMPHPERAFLGWQMPWFPDDVGLTADGPGPWLKMFQNARVWAEKHE